MVHGLAEATLEMADGIIAFVTRFIEYFSQRLAIAERGPLRGVLRAILEESKRLYDEEVATTAGQPSTEEGGDNDWSTWRHGLIDAVGRG